jgi:indolepyruvate ferredoxin oxidoreductase alpha subunit
MRTEVLERAGRRVVLLGNEAIARGALEAGVGMVTAYPGTPSSEVPMTLAPLAKKQGFYFEYSANEKVAFEAATGAAWSGVRALTTMKQFGLNVCADSVLPVAYTGVRAGFVIMVADDPYGWSSAQSEQDTRYYARMARLPMLDPANPEECLALTKVAFRLSEEFQIPVFLRTTTMVSHSIGTVKLGKLQRPKAKGLFRKDPSRYYNIRPNLQVLHEQLDLKLKRIEQKYGKRLNKVFSGTGEIGLVTAGVAFEYAREALLLLGLNPPIIKISLSHPLQHAMIADFIRKKRAVLVLEELEPIIEDFIRQIAKDANPDIVIHGKDMLPRSGEYNLETIMPVLEEVFGKKHKVNLKAHKLRVDRAVHGLPPRKPVWCPGCPHRSTFYAVRKVFGEKPIFAGDIGCYILGVLEPYAMQDFCISMGAGLGIAHGIARATDQQVIAFIGDSTFFHAGMPGLVNLKFNDGTSPLVIVLDNDITAMTGHQPHPGTGFTGMGEKVQPVRQEDVAVALGAEVRIASSFRLKALVQALQELKVRSGPRVLISRGACRLLTKRALRAKGLDFTKFRIDQSKCSKCSECTDRFACPAIAEIRKRPGEVPAYEINAEMCWGCGVCAQICPSGAIRQVK